MAVFLDLNRWRDVVYVLIAFPLAVLEFVVVVALWAAALGLLALPLGYLVGDLPVQLRRIDSRASSPGSASRAGRCSPAGVLAGPCSWSWPRS